VDRQSWRGCRIECRVALGLGICFTSMPRLTFAQIQARLNLIRPWQFLDVPQGGSVWIFAVDQ
jgi:hypothetical protein